MTTLPALTPQTARQSLPLNLPGSEVLTAVMPASCLEWKLALFLCRWWWLCYWCSALLLVLSLAAAKKPTSCINELGKAGFSGCGLRKVSARFKFFCGVLGAVYSLLWFVGWVDEAQIGDKRSSSGCYGFTPAAGMTERNLSER